MTVARAPAAWPSCGGDFGERVWRIDFDAVREEQSLLGEVALNLRAQRGFPRVADHDVENGGGGGDDDQEDGEQLEEDAVLHVRLLEVAREASLIGVDFHPRAQNSTRFIAPHLGTSKRYPAPRTVFR